MVGSEGRDRGTQQNRNIETDKRPQGYNLNVVFYKPEEKKVLDR